MPSALSHQDKCFSAMAKWFLCCTSQTVLEIFRNDPFMKIIHAVSGDKAKRTLTIPHLKIFINTEWNAFIKFVQKEVHGHHAESMFNQFCQSVHDGCALVNKE